MNFNPQNYFKTKEHFFVGDLRIIISHQAVELQLQSWCHHSCFSSFFSVMKYFLLKKRICRKFLQQW